MIHLNTCPLTGLNIKMETGTNAEEYFYETPLTGKIKMTDVALDMCQGLKQDEKIKLIGISKNFSIQNQEPLLITARFLNGLKEQETPVDFRSKASHFLRYLNSLNDKKFTGILINTEADSSIAYAEKDEFESIISYLYEDELIKYENQVKTKQTTFYQKLRISKKGMEHLSNPSQKNNHDDLNSEIDIIETQLRELIVRTFSKNNLFEYEQILSGDSKQQVRRRIQLFLEKHPNRLIDEFNNLSEAIQFCDIEHLKKTILKNEFWGFFVAIFKDKSKTETYFDQLSEIRHAIKHTREVSEIVYLEGKAALVWFNMIII